MDIWNQYSLANIERAEPLGSAGGFSGAQLTRLYTLDGEYCLRRWPLSHPTYEHLSWIHLVLTHAYRENCGFVAVPIRNREQQTITRFDSALWEVTRWMPGTADYCHDPNEERLANMVQSLARFHLSSAQVSLDFRVSHNLVSRIKQLSDLPLLLSKIRHSNMPQVDAFVSSATAPKTPVGWAEKLANFRSDVLAIAPQVSANLRHELLRFENQLFAVQPIIRDVWHDHVLFTNNEVTGLVDFGAMQMDNVAYDIARLLGSTIGDDQVRWSAALEHYNQIRRLAEPEVLLATALDRSGTLLGSLNWLKWILLEQRVFENYQAVEKRIEYLQKRLRTLC